MRELTGPALTQIANQYGNAPVTILEINWTGDAIEAYADKDIDEPNYSCLGKILNVTDLDNIINVSNSSDTQELSVVLDDTDGTIKNYMNRNDIHKRNVWVYQWFSGMNLAADRFLLFKGKINSPIEWNEGERTVSFAIVSQIEDKEVGFSPEEGQFPAIPRDMIGKTWPSIFGTCLDVPAVQISKVVEGTTLSGIGIISGRANYLGVGIGGDPPDTRLAEIQLSHVSYLSGAWGNHPEADDYREQANELRAQITAAWSDYNSNQGCVASKRAQVMDTAEANGLGTNPVRILGGEDFPRGTITLNIKDGLFTGHFEHDLFYITSRLHIEDEAETDQNRIAIGIPCTYNNASGAGPYYFEDPTPTGTYVSEGVITDFGRGGIPISNATSGLAKHFWADAGSKATLAGDTPITYIVSIVPGIVLQVKAFKDFHGDRQLVNVPNNLWSTSVKVYGSVTAVQVKINKALSTIEGQNWAGDDIYVTFQSDIGPNIVTIMEYLIDLYSDLTTDEMSFDNVEMLTTPFPANFALLDRTNIVSLLQEISYQARCALRISNDVFYLTYLPLEPTSVVTLTEQDIEHQSVRVTATETEDLVTKLTALWRLSYAQEDLDKIVLRHNVDKYGIQEEEYDFYIYNQPDIIHKVATFWLIRKANTWKKIQCNLFLNHLNLEAFDCVTFNFATDYISSSPTKALVETAIYDSENHTIAMECWLPIKLGEMETYTFAWTAGVEATASFPTVEEIADGHAGGDGIGADATGNLPVGQIPVGGSVVYVGGINVYFGPQTDRGDPTPSDLGFTAQSLGITTNLAEIDVSAKPAIDFTQYYGEHAPILQLPDRPQPLVLILETTKIISNSDADEGKVGYLSNIMRFDEEDGVASQLGIKLETNIINAAKIFSPLNTILSLTEDDGFTSLSISTSATFTDGSNTEEFHFIYDSEGEKWGAGTAYLQD